MPPRSPGLYSSAPPHPVVPKVGDTNHPLTMGCPSWRPPTMVWGWSAPPGTAVGVRDWAKAALLMRTDKRAPVATIFMACLRVDVFVLRCRSRAGPVQPPCRGKPRTIRGRSSGADSCPRTSTRTAVRSGRRSALGARRPDRDGWCLAARSDTLPVLADLAHLAVVLEGAALAGALAFGFRAWRSREAAARRGASLEARLEEQRSAGERREGLLRTVVETT